MWQRSNLKKEARGNFRQNYFPMIAVCFLLAFLVVEYSGTTFFVGTDVAKNETEIIVKNGIKKVSLGNTLAEKLDGVASKYSLLPEKAQKGAIIGMVNSWSQAKETSFHLYETVKKTIQKNKPLFKVFSILLLIFEIFILIFVRFILIVGERRFFLENKNHPKTRVMRVIFLYRERKILNPAKVMLMRNIFYGLWSLTIVGIAIKWYSYKLVPYIVAENPDVTWKEALNLSKKMAKGQKFKMFLLDISFWYWYLIKWGTFGIFGIFFLNPYLRATEVELYVALREEAIKNKIPFHEKLNDFELYLEEDAVNSPVYPGVAVKHKRHAIVDYRRTYSGINLVLFFFSFSLLGWIWEVSLHIFRDGEFVNRGTMYGPWLPIYGCGGVLLLLVLKRFREKPFLTFFMSMVLCGVVEYFTSFFLEVTKGDKWWDYSGYFLNLNGRVCLEGLLVFALGGCAFIYVLAPMLDDLYNKLPKSVKSSLVVILIMIFSVDFGYAYFNPNQGEGITIKGGKK